MRDIDIAVKLLNEEKLTLAVVKGGQTVYKSKAIGVLPLYVAATNEEYDIKGSAVADKVTGKGAALLCAYGKITKLNTRLMSKHAQKVLDAAGIEYSYDKLVNGIKNRTGDGGCPVEALTKDIENPAEALEPIKGFLTGIGVL